MGSVMFRVNFSHPVKVCARRICRAEIQNCSGMMNLLVADAFSKKHLDELSGLVNVRYEPALTAEQLPQALGGVHLLVVRGKKVTREAIEAGESLALIVRAGAGVNTIDVQAASRRGIFVTNCPGKNSIAVAELTFGLILALDRRIPENNAELHAGRWKKSEFSKARGLYGRTIGIAGLGSIGSEVAARASAFGMSVAGWSRSLTDEKAKQLGIERAPSLAALAARSDVVTLHLALSPETKNVINKDFFNAMKPGAMLVNCARGEIVDTGAMMDAIKQKGIRVALDVFPDEPAGGSAEYHHPLLDLPGVYGTHHIGASTDQAQEAIADEAIRMIRKFLRSGEVDNCVNLSKNTPATHQLIVRHLDKVGVLASVLDLLRRREINVEEMENSIFQGTEAACCRIRLSAAPPADILESMRGMEAILHVELLSLR